MNDHSKRRKFLKNVLALPAVASAGMILNTQPANAKEGLMDKGINRFKTSLNAFSFNDPLLNGSMNLDQLLEYCAESGFDAADLTAYYFPGYPNVPADEYLYHLKRKAFSLGLEISGTGVRNDFTDPDKKKRKESISLVKKWIEAAEKMGAPVIRIFAGNQKPEGYTREQINNWMRNDIADCVEYGKKHGIVAAIQNHNDFIQTSDHAIEIINMINEPEWFGLILDTGSYRVGDPYEEIAKTANYAVNWQVKENIFINGAEQETDLDKLIDIIKASKYRGYLPIETLGAGDPKIKVSNLLNKLKKALS